MHEFAFSKKDTNQILTEINEQIWKSSREVDISNKFLIIGHSCYSLFGRYA